MDTLRPARRHLGKVPLVLLVFLPLAAGCSSLGNVAPTLPERYALSRDQLLLHSDFPLVAEHRLLEELTARRLDVSRTLALPVSNEPIHVFVFESPERFDAFLKLNHPDFPRRRAFFVETDTRLLVYAQWDDRVAEDLRHELAHAYLHAVVPRLPLWLDEGLAEYYEVPRGRDGLNPAHLEWIARQWERGTWRPDLRRLERFESSFEMGQDEYAESWAWAHFLLHSGPERLAVLLGYLEQLRRDGTAEPLSTRLGPMPGNPEEALAEHVARLIAANRAE